MEALMEKYSLKLNISDELIDRYIKRELFMDIYYNERPTISLNELNEISKREN